MALRYNGRAGCDMDMSPMALITGMVFGGAGMVAWSMGRKRDKAAWMLIGVALMVYPWVVEGAVLQGAVGLGLVALLFVT